jgi:hypothetical protein
MRRARVRVPVRGIGRSVPNSVDPHSLERGHRAPQRDRPEARIQHHDFGSRSHFHHVRSCACQSLGPLAPESKGCGPTPVLKECSYKYLPFSPNAGPRRCSPTFDLFANVGSIEPEKRTTGLATPCNLGKFSSGAPFVVSRGSAIVGVTKVGIHASTSLDPFAPARTAPGSCCTAIFTPLRLDAFRLALKAEGQR